MAEYWNVKLMSGDDIVGVLEYDDDDHIQISNPIAIDIDPVEGAFARSYLMLSEENTVVFYRSDIVHLARANKKACEYYDAFVKQLSIGEYEDTDPDSEFYEEVEDVFTSMLEAKASTKH